MRIKGNIVKNFFTVTFTLLCILFLMYAESVDAEVQCAIVQYEIQDDDMVGIDDDRVDSFVRDAAGNGAQIVVVPETCFYRYDPWEQNGVTMLDLADNYDFLWNKFSNLADELNICLVIGLREPSGDPDKPVYNTALFFGPNGSELGKHHKVVPSNSEMAWTKAGTSADAFETPYGRVGMLICKDLKSGSWYQAYNSQNIDLFILIAGDGNGTSFSRFDDTCSQADCHGIMSNQITGHGSGAGNSAWGYPDGTVNFLGGGEQIFYNTLPLPEPAGVPMDGQIVIDPDHPEWMKYHNGGPFFMCGPGDPEGFLYRGTRNPDGTRSGDQMILINKLKSTGANCIYLMAIRSHGGDGDSTQNPFINFDSTNALDEDILDQWETWFTDMDNNGIVIYFFFYDDNIRVSNNLGWPLDGSGNLHSQEQYFVETIVNRFEHHKNLVWCVMEEVQEMGSDYAAHAGKIAEVIRNTDDHDHVTAVHQLSGLSFIFADDPNIDQFAIQTNGTASQLHSNMVTAWNNAAGRYSLNMSEAPSYGTGSTMRKKNWACAMGGAYVMILGMDIAGTSVSDLESCGYVVEFFEQTTFNEMAPHDELKNGATDYVLALPGQSYIMYADGSGDLGIDSLTSGTYNLLWFDPADGSQEIETGVSAGAGTQYFTRPASVGAEAALYLVRTGGGANAAPTANGQNVTVNQDSSIGISLGYSDPDGPGPYTFQIQQQPAYGSLTGSGQSRTYTPDPGYSGNDSFIFTVHDGLELSNEATVAITVQSVINQPPVAEDKSLAVQMDTAVYVQLSYHDPDSGPGPYTMAIIDLPLHGDLTGSGNDRYYMPEAGYVGTDYFTWKVHDGEDDSNVATVNITVTEPGAPLTAAVSADVTAGEAPLNVNFTGQASGGLSGNGEVVESDGMAVIEAEDFHGNDGRTDPNGIEWGMDSVRAGYAGDGYAATPGPQGTNASWSNGCEVTYEIQFNTAGTYYVWLRRNAPDTGSNSCFVGMDGIQIGSTVDNTQSDFGVWVWHKHSTAVTITEGIHTFNLRRREAAYQVDRIVLTMDPGYTPAGQGPQESVRAGAYTYAWDFGDGTQVSYEQNPQHIYTEAGNYSATLTVGDGIGIAFDTVEIEVSEGGGSNMPPSVEAGVDQEIILPDDTVNLDGTVTDPDDTPDIAWSKVSGPGIVQFSNAGAVDTSATFMEAGTYVLRLTANDGTNPPVSDDVSITVNPAPGDDVDGDGIPDRWEEEYFGNPENCDPDADPDDDGLTNREEYNAGTDPTDPDTDDDGMIDSQDPDPLKGKNVDNGIGGCSRGSGGNAGSCWMLLSMIVVGCVMHLRRGIFQEVFIK